jgi:hypothetical protein
MMPSIIHLKWFEHVDVCEGSDWGGRDVPRARPRRVSRTSTRMSRSDRGARLECAWARRVAIRVCRSGHNLRTLVDLPQLRTDPKGCPRPSALHAPGVSSSLDSTQVPPAVFIDAARQETWTDGAESRAHSGHRRTQVPQSSVRLPTDRADHFADVRDRRHKNVVYRVVAKHYRPAREGTGPSWLSFIGHTKDSLWSVDLFRCESIVLRSYWVLVVMDQFTRRLVGFGVHGGTVTGADVCRMFNAAIHRQGAPQYFSTDHDPLFAAHRWMANLRTLEIEEIKTVRHVPLSHPLVERLDLNDEARILDHVLCWNAVTWSANLPSSRCTTRRHAVTRRWTAARR